MDGAEPTSNILVLDLNQFDAERRRLVIEAIKEGKASCEPSVATSIHNPSITFNALSSHSDNAKVKDS